VATSTLPSPRNSEDALREYLAIREQLAEFEDRDTECTCDPDEFHTCEICGDYAEKNRRAQSLLKLWGDNWAVELGTLKADEGKRAIDCAIDREIARAERVLAQGELSLCSSSRGTGRRWLPCYKLATVHHLATGLEYCQDHFEEVCCG
jgi:hypothetical protein